jgi:hypothetical protein
MKKEAGYFLLYTLLTILGVTLFFALGKPFLSQITGYTIYEQQGNQFDNGTYTNTLYNNTGIVLAGKNLSGFYTSPVIDAGFNAQWNNFSWQGYSHDKTNISVTLAFHKRRNITQVYKKDETYYKADMEIKNKKFFLNFSYDLFNQTILKVYAKKDKGKTIGVYTQTDKNGEFALGNVTINATIGAWYETILSIITPTPFIWLGEGNGSGNNPKDDFDYVYAEIPSSTISFQIKNCSLADCSDGVWQPVNTQNSQTGRYFQYLINFSAPDSALSPFVKGVKLEYTILNTPPQITVLALENKNYSVNESIHLNISVSDDENNLQTCWYNLNQGINTTIANCQNTSLIISTAGNYTLTIFANDSLGYESSAIRALTINAIDNSQNQSNNTQENGTQSNQTNRTPENNMSNETIDNQTIREEAPTGNSAGGGSGNTRGGGGGGGSPTTNQIITIPQSSLTLSTLTPFIGRKGETKTFSVKATNTGAIPLRNCKIQGVNQIASWITAQEQYTLAINETKDISFAITIPREIDEQDYQETVALECDETAAAAQMLLTILQTQETIQIQQIAQEENRVIIDYLYNTNLVGAATSIDAWVEDEQQQKITQTSDSFSVENEDAVERTITLQLPQDSVGVFTVALASSTIENQVKQTIIVEKRNAGLLGAALDFTKQRTGYVVLGLIVLMTLIMLSVIIISQKKTKKKFSKLLDNFKY